MDKETKIFPKTKELNKRRVIGMLLSGARSQNTALSAVDYYQGHGRIFLVESFLDKRETSLLDQDNMLVAKLKDSIDTRTTPLVLTNAPLSLPPCYSCTVSQCPGKDKCTVPETVKIMELYSEMRKKRKNLRKFLPYTQRYSDLRVRQLFPKISVPHEPMGSNLAQITSRILHIKKMMPQLIFKESYPPACIFSLLPTLGLKESFMDRYKNIYRGASYRERFLRRLEEHFGIFVYDVDMNLMIRNINVFESLVLAVLGVLHLVGETQSISDGFVLPK